MRWDARVRVGRVLTKPAVLFVSSLLVEEMLPLVRSSRTGRREPLRHRLVLAFIVCDSTQHLVVILRWLILVYGDLGFYIT